MVEITCPVCSKSNPADATTCQHCGASLRPAGRSATDWLGGLRAESEASESETTLPGSEDDIPEWLRRVRERNEADQSTDQEPEDSDEAPADDLPDWLRGIGEPSEQKEKPIDWRESLSTWKREPESQPPTEPEKPGEPVLPPFEPESETPDWLKALGELPHHDIPEPVKPTAPMSRLDEPDEEEEGVPHWLKPYSDDEPDLIRPSKPQEEPDWLKEFGQFTNSNENNSEKPQDDALPGWLSPSDPFSGGQQPAEQPGETFPERRSASEDTPTKPSEPPAWLKDLKAEQAAQEKAPPETPAWLESFKAEDTPLPGELASETPGWLNNFKAEEPAAPGETPAETPDWLNSFKAEEPAAPGETPAETPDWLNNFKAEEPAALDNTPTESVEEIPADAEKLPTGLVEGEEKFGLEETMADDERKPSEEDELDWLRELPKETVAPGKESENLDQWLIGLGSTSTAFTLDETAEKEAENHETTPAFIELGPVETPAIAQPEEKTAEIPSLEEILPAGEEPSMEYEDLEKALAGLDMTEETVEEQEPPVEPSAELAEAELPAWLREIRPVEMVVDSASRAVDEQRVEKAGPLAGLQGTLPPEDLSALYERPPVYSSRLSLNEKQRIHAAMLEGLIADEGKPKGAAAAPALSPIRLARSLVGLLLILLIVAPLMTGGPGALVLPYAAAPETAAFHETLSSLPAGAPVLVAFDYEASAAGEMRFAAASLIEMLMSRGQAVITVSTLPTGPVLADALLTSSWNNLNKYNPAAANAYSLATQTTNLGYLPGGAAGLREFAVSPRQAVVYELSAGPAWSKPDLSSVERLADFAAVIVLTDGVETGRAWVEQAAPMLAGKPLLFVASAQAAPMLTPYAASGQITAMLTGLAGGAAFERAAGLPGYGPAYWNAYQYGMLFAIVLLIIGALAQGVAGFSNRQKSKRES